jgi:hypothetical protein
VHPVEILTNTQLEADLGDDVVITAVGLTGQSHVQLAVRAQGVDVAAAHAEVEHRRRDQALHRHLDRLAQLTPA